MDDDKLLQLLARSPLGRDLAPPVLGELLAAARLRRVERGAYFFHQDEPATTFYVVVNGRVRLSQVTPEGHQVTVHYLGSGDAMAIIVALSGMPYPVTAEAIEDTEALAWDQVPFAALMQRHAQLALNGMRLIARRFADLQDRYRELATERVERRVARTLLRLVRQAGRRVDNGVLIDMPLSRQDLAEMTGTTLYTVSRILSDWENRGLVRTGREQVILCRSHDIVVIAEDLPHAGEE